MFVCICTYILLFTHSFKVFTKNLVLPSIVLGARDTIGTKIWVLWIYILFLDIKLYRHSMNVSLCGLILYWSFLMHSAWDMKLFGWIAHYNVISRCCYLMCLFIHLNFLPKIFIIQLSLYWGKIYTRWNIQLIGITWNSWLHSTCINTVSTCWLSSPTVLHYLWLPFHKLK